MPLVEIVILKLGSAIAKSILQLWMKNIPVVPGMSSSMVDLIDSRISDKIAQQKVRRQFEAIGEKVGESIFPLFEIEEKHLDEASRTAVALAVAETFDKAQISSKLIAEHNLEPGKLAKFVQSANPKATKDFKDSEVSLYLRIIKECCNYIVDIASQLPIFSEQVFAEILKREDQLISITKDVLQNIQQMRAQLNPLVESQRFELEYRRAISRNLDVLELFGTDVSLASKRHRLSVAYVTLSVEHRVLSTSPIILEEGKNSIQNEHLDSSRGDTLVSVDEALSNSSRLLIRGLAGSGKTTLLQWIAVRSAERTFEGKLATWNTTIPFYIRLRHCIKSTELPAPKDFPNLVANSVADMMPKGWVNEQLRLGNAIVLIDGLDEVPAKRRDEVRKWLEDLIGSYPMARYIVTSRPHAVKEGWLNEVDFDYAELQPMVMRDIRAFIDHWHKAVQEELQDETERAELPFLVHHLKEIVMVNRAIRNLASNPLLCAMLCALNRDRRKQLPADRIELYEACCYMLIERLDKERLIELSDYPTLTYRQKRLLLEDFAYWLTRNGWSEVELQEADNHFARKLANVSNLPPELSGPAVRSLFVERTSILREPIDGRIDFTHRTFQEFLAAQAAVDEGDLGLLIENADNVQWREVFILATGLAKKKSEYLLSQIIKRGNEEEKNRYRLHLLAVSCLETSVELGQDIRGEIERLLGTLVPPTNIADAVAMASAGDLAVPYLAPKENFSVSILQLCIRSLALIGSESALDALEDYNHFEDTGVIDALWAAWDSFNDKKAYAQRILSAVLKGAFRIKDPRSVTSLSGFQFFSKLTSLDLSNCNQISDISPLARLTQLTSLVFAGCEQITQLHPLAKLTQLITLDLQSCRVADLSPLAGLTQLTSLNLSGCKRITDLSPFVKLTQLTSLNLSRCEEIIDLSTLVKLTQLTFLNLQSCSRIIDLSPLVKLTQLTFLNLQSCRQVIDLSPLAKLTQLTSLNLSRCEEITDLSPLARLTQLTSLNLSGCWQLTQFSPLAKLTQLTSLNLSECEEITDLSPLASMDRLTSLDLQSCKQITNLGPLAKLAQLASMNLSGCIGISDLGPLEALPHLLRLDISGCERIEVLDPQQGFRSLRQLVAENIVNRLVISVKLKKRVKIGSHIEFFGSAVPLGQLISAN